MSQILENYKLYDKKFHNKICPHRFQQSVCTCSDKIEVRVEGLVSTMLGVRAQKGQCSPYNCSYYAGNCVEMIYNIKRSQQVKHKTKYEKKTIIHIEDFFLQNLSKEVYRLRPSHAYFRVSAYRSSSANSTLKSRKTDFSSSTCTCLGVYGLTRIHCLLRVRPSRYQGSTCWSAFQHRVCMYVPSLCACGLLGERPAAAARPCG